MKKNFSEYKIYAFDLDGTIYDQPALRMIMAKRLLGYYILHPFRIGELLIIKDFRKLKDSWEDDGVSASNATAQIDGIDARICEYIANRKKKSPEKVISIIYKWIYDNPLSALYDTRDVRLIEKIDNMRKKGMKVVVFSDYPPAKKLLALGIEVDGIYSAQDDRIGELKPSPKGLIVIANDYNVSPEDIIMIGDRMEKDGVSAQTAGCDYIILPRKIKERDSFYESMRID